MDQQPRRKLSPETVRLAGAAALVLLMLAFVIDNRHSVRVGFVLTDRRVPLIAVLLITAVVGAVIDRLLRWRSRRKPSAD